MFCQMKFLLAKTQNKPGCSAPERQAQEGLQMRPLPSRQAPTLPLLPSTGLQTSTDSGRDRGGWADLPAPDPGHWGPSFNPNGCQKKAKEIVRALWFRPSILRNLFIRVFVRRSRRVIRLRYRQIFLRLTLFS